MQTLRNAPDALEGRRLRGGVFEIEPDHIETSGRLDDRLQIEIAGLKASISRSGQRVPILVRPLDGDRYSLIYGRRRLEACRELGIKVRAIVTEMDGDQALRDQLLENQERRDLSFIERALVAAALLNGDHLGEPERTNKGVAEVLNLTEAGVSQLLSVVRTVGEDLVLAIGAAPGIGRPRWEELKKAMSDAQVDRRATSRHWRLTPSPPILAGLTRSLMRRSWRSWLPQGRPDRPSPVPKSLREPSVVIPGVGAATVTTGRRGRQLKLDLKADDTDFVSWLEGKAPQLIAELHERWKRKED